jgi:hypothetical protein
MTVPHQGMVVLAVFVLPRLLEQDYRAIRDDDPHRGNTAQRKG